MMTPDQALTVLDQISARAVATRQDHVLVVEALNVLRELVNAEPPPAVTAGPPPTDPPADPPADPPVTDDQDPPPPSG